MEQVIRPAEQKVKVFKVSDPNQIRYVTKVAAGYLAPKWAVSEVQEQPKKKEVVKLVESVPDNRPALRSEYKALTGKDADEKWNEARLYVEISIVKSQAKKIDSAMVVIAEEAQDSQSIQTTEPPRQKRKYTKRQKQPA